MDIGFEEEIRKPSLNPIRFVTSIYAEITLGKVSICLLPSNMG